MLDKNQAKTIIEKIQSYTRYDASVVILDDEQGVTRFANSEINQNVCIADTNISLTLYDGKKEATCSGNVGTDDGLRKLVQDAEAILPYVPDGEFEYFPASEEPVPEAVNDARIADAFNVTERAARIKKGILTLEDGYTGAGALTLNRTAFAVGGSRGAFRYAAFDGVQFNVVVTHANGAAGSAECVAYGLDGMDMDAAFEKARRIAVMARQPVSTDLGAYTVILSPVAFGDLMAFVTMPLCAKWIDEGDSFAIGKLNTRVFGENINCRDDVTFPGGRPLYFDYEGNVRKSLGLIENGVINNLLYDNKIAKRHNTQTTGHAVSNKGYGGYPMNLVVDGGEQSLDEIIAGTEKGIYINEFNYTNYVNTRNLQITGLTRNGAFLIENGKLGRAVTTMRFTQNLIDSLNAVTAISKERTWVNAYDTIYYMPAVKIEGFHFTSKQ